MKEEVREVDPLAELDPVKCEPEHESEPEPEPMTYEPEPDLVEEDVGKGGSGLRMKSIL